jgi:hypothetical protein
MIVIAVPVFLYWVMVWVETDSLTPLANKVGVSPTKGALIQYTTDLLENKIGASRTEVQATLQSIGGTFTVVDHSIGERKIDSAYWTMGTVPWGKLWTVWILEYDGNDTLLSVGVGSS